MFSMVPAPWFFWLKVSLATMTTLASPSPAATARSNPRWFSTRPIERGSNSLRQSRHHGVGIGHLRHALGIDEAGDLHPVPPQRQKRAGSVRVWSRYQGASDRFVYRRVERLQQSQRNLQAPSSLRANFVSILSDESCKITMPMNTSARCRKRGRDERGGEQAQGRSPIFG